MQRILLFGALSLLALAAPQAIGQGRGPYVRPAVNPYARSAFSPYLNLLRRDGNPAVNYYGIVRPEIEFRNSLQQLQGQVNAVEASTAAEEAGAAGITGHPTLFLRYSHFYPSLGVSGGAGRRTTGQVPAVSPRPGGAPTTSSRLPAAR